MAGGYNRRAIWLPNASCWNIHEARACPRITQLNRLPDGTLLKSAPISRCRNRCRLPSAYGSSLTSRKWVPTVPCRKCRACRGQSRAAICVARPLIGMRWQMASLQRSNFTSAKSAWSSETVSAAAAAAATDLGAQFRQPCAPYPQKVGTRRRAMAAGVLCSHQPLQNVI